MTSVSNQYVNTLTQQTDATPKGYGNSTLVDFNNPTKKAQMITSNNFCSSMDGSTNGYLHNLIKEYEKQQ